MDNQTINKAAEIRTALADLGLYLTRNVNSDPGYAAFEGNARAWLPDLLGNLDRTEVIAVFQLVSILAAVPRVGGDDIFCYAAELSAFRLALAVEAGELPAVPGMLTLDEIMSQKRRKLAATA